MTIEREGMNPYVFARHISAVDFPCPGCGAHAHLIASVSGSCVDVSADCPSCGKLELGSGNDEDGDVFLEFGGKRCPITFESKAVEGMSGMKSVSDARLFAEAGVSVIGYTSPVAGEKMLREVCEVCASNISNPGWEGAENLCAESVVALSDVFQESGRFPEAVELMKVYRGVAEGSNILPQYVSCAICAQLVAGDLTEGLKDLRSIIKKMADAPSPHDYRIVPLYCVLGAALVEKRDLQAALKAYGSAVKEAYKISPLTEDSLTNLLIASSEYAYVAILIHQEKKGTEAIKNAVKLCRENRTAFPRQYANSLINKSKHMMDLDAIDPSMKNYLDEAIGILELLPGARDDPLLPIAWYYRSASSGKRDSLDLDDMAKAYSYIRDGMVRNVYPDDMVFNVTGTYVQYLDFFDREKSTEVRKELASYGFVFPPPPVLKDGPIPGMESAGRNDQ